MSAGLAVSDEPTLNSIRFHVEHPRTLRNGAMVLVSLSPCPSADTTRPSPGSPAAKRCQAFRFLGCPTAHMLGQEDD